MYNIEEMRDVTLELASKINQLAKLKKAKGSEEEINALQAEINALREKRTGMIKEMDSKEA